MTQTLYKSNAGAVTALADHPFLSTMPTNSLRRLAAHVQHKDIPSGHTIFREGDEADRFFLIRQGVVRLDMEVPGRGRVDIEMLGADCALGWSWLFPPYRWHLTATAIERTSVLVFDASMLRSLMASDPLTGYEMMRRFAAIIFDRLGSTRLQVGDEPETIPAAGVSGPWAARDGWRGVRLPS
jgi:CRP/FNR family cyclic AMP-dependent transcriptional regulator